MFRKNSLVAHNNINNTDDSIKIMVSEGEQYINIKISDVGGGFNIAELEKNMSYSFTTSEQSLDLIDRIPAISGFGFGLPMIGLYASYFDGKFIINPIENYGTDTFLYLNKLGYNTEKLY